MTNPVPKLCGPSGVDAEGLSSKEDEQLLPWPYAGSQLLKRLLAFIRLVKMCILFGEFVEGLGNCGEIFDEASVVRSQADKLMHFRDVSGCGLLSHLLNLLGVSGDTFAGDDVPQVSHSLSEQETL